MDIEKEISDISDTYFDGLKTVTRRLASNALYLMRTKKCSREEVLFLIARHCGSSVACDVELVLDELHLEDCKMEV